MKKILVTIAVFWIAIAQGQDRTVFYLEKVFPCFDGELRCDTICDEISWDDSFFVFHRAYYLPMDLFHVENVAAAKTEYAQYPRERLVIRNFTPEILDFGGDNQVIFELLLADGTFVPPSDLVPIVQTGDSALTSYFAQQQTFFAERDGIFMLYAGAKQKISGFFFYTKMEETISSEDFKELTRE